MKISQALQLKAQRQIEGAELLRNPSDHSQWFIMLTEKGGKKYMLANDQDDPIVDTELENLLKLLKSLGIHKAEITP